MLAMAAASADVDTLRALARLAIFPLAASLAIATATIKVVMGEITTPPDCATPAMAGNCEFVSESVQLVALTMVPTSNVPEMVYLPGELAPTSIAVALSVDTVQPTAAPSNTSTVVVGVGLVVDPPPPQAISPDRIKIKKAGLMVNNRLFGIL